MVFFAAGTAKVAGSQRMVALFDAIGAGQWLRYAVGLAEIAGAVLLLVPSAASRSASCAGALLLAAVMLGAIVVDSFVLRRRPYLSVVFLFLMVTVAWVRH